MAKDIINVSVKYLPVSIVTGFILIALLYGIEKSFNGIAKRMDRHSTMKDELNRMIVLFAFIIYLFMVIGIVFLSREPGSRDAIRLQLFCIFSENIWAKTFAIENIIMFIPFGFMLPLLWNQYNSFRRCIFAGLLSSIAIEVVQYVTKTGYCELDDVLNNLMGTMIGYGVLVAVKITGRILKRIE